MKINILTIGTRGDVQPYLGLGAGLAARGHDVAVQTLAEFKDAVEDAGLEHRPLRGDFIAVAQARGVEAPPPLEMMREYRRMAAETLRRVGCREGRRPSGVQPGCVGRTAHSGEARHPRIRRVPYTDVHADANVPESVHPTWVAPAVQQGVALVRDQVRSSGLPQADQPLAA